MYNHDIQQAKITCKTCQRHTTITLVSKEEIKEFKTYKKGFNCGLCAWKFWSPKIASGEINKNGNRISKW